MGAPTGSFALEMATLPVETGPSASASPQPSIVTVAGRSLACCTMTAQTSAPGCQACAPMLTAKTAAADLLAAIEAGADDYLSKPYQEAQLLDAIAPLVERYRAAQNSRKLAEARVN